MTAKYFVTPEGSYIGAFDGAEPPHGSIEVPFAPDDARQVWGGRAWSALVPDLADYQRAIDAHIDATAAAKSYASGVSCASYVNSTNQQWADEAAAFIAWRDSVWAYAYAELDKVLTGKREAPTVAGLIKELPAVNW